VQFDHTHVYINIILSTTCERWTCFGPPTRHVHIPRRVYYLIKYSVFRRIENPLAFIGVAIHDWRNTPRFYHFSVRLLKCKPTGIFRRGLKHGVLLPSCVTTSIRNNEFWIGRKMPRIMRRTKRSRKCRVGIGWLLS